MIRLWWDSNLIIILSSYECKVCFHVVYIVRNINQFPTDCMIYRLLSFSFPHYHTRASADRIAFTSFHKHRRLRINISNFKSMMNSFFLSLSFFAVSWTRQMPFEFVMHETSFHVIGRKKTWNDKKREENIA